MQSKHVYIITSFVMTVVLAGCQLATTAKPTNQLDFKENVIAAKKTAFIQHADFEPSEAFAFLQGTAFRNSFHLDDRSLLEVELIATISAQPLTVWIGTDQQPLGRELGPLEGTAETGFFFRHIDQQDLSAHNIVSLVVPSSQATIAAQARFQPGNQ